MATRRKYSREFKIEAVRMITQLNLSVAEVARDLDVSGTVLRRWKKELASGGEQAFPGNGKLTGEQEELRKLREENRQLRMERDILKKATAFFAKESK
jgi:transposase